jgi:hypothetical protein
MTRAKEAKQVENTVLQFTALRNIAIQGNSFVHLTEAAEGRPDFLKGRDLRVSILPGWSDEEHAPFADVGTIRGIRSRRLCRQTTHLYIQNVSVKISETQVNLSAYTNLTHFAVDVIKDIIPSMQEFIKPVQRLKRLKMIVFVIYWPPDAGHIGQPTLLRQLSESCNGDSRMYWYTEDNRKMYCVPRREVAGKKMLQWDREPDLATMWSCAVPFGPLDAYF